MSDKEFRVHMASGTDDPLSDSEIQAYRERINELDRTIIEAIHARSEISQKIGRTRLSSGGTKLVYNREVAIINQFKHEFGPAGVDIAKALLKLGRGNLG